MVRDKNTLVWSELHHTFILSLAAFALKQQSWIAVAETVWPAMSKIFTIRPSVRKVCRSLIQIVPFSPNSPSGWHLSSLFYHEGSWGWEKAGNLLKVIESIGNVIKMSVDNSIRSPTTVISHHPGPQWGDAVGQRNQMPKWAQRQE